MIYTYAEMFEKSLIEYIPIVVPVLLTNWQRMLHSDISYLARQGEANSGLFRPKIMRGK